MYCSTCGKEISKESKFCRHCGHKLITESSDIVKPSAISKDTSSGVKQILSIKKFFLFNLLTFGIYTAYWGWKNWEIVKRVKGLDVNPGARGFFIVFTSFSLFKEILSLAKNYGYKGNYVPWLLGLGLLAINLIYNLFSRAVEKVEEIDLTAFLIITAIFIVLITLVTAPVINAMNYFLKHNKEESSKFEIKHNYVLIVLLAVIFIFYSIFGLIEGFYTTSYTEATKIEFVNSCVDAGGTRNYCECFYKELQSRLSYQELLTYGLTGQDLPDKQVIIHACSGSN
ncbi:MAG: hypothetical protein US86_C0003G0087 [Candidatus Daviesbacteria bacterium GW2011_GWA2_38_24]|uniref:Zinc-ribbon domain-containing protein n=1 Tax=Candidatus Daviesbacteria bacterium GW2011_GWA2_38_24 TaxID=1618422 RepID=A0A0G0LZN4_9BACT|nr:MAG: hypothetical protein US86_C0003G0087 [Candidatus Daviesbacteria bacterium GW2011_GWA2_38_24]KKQ80229.1 MAG: hypothetical protein UT01_C0016G0010 [Candidatus Daviesbacteria bacterium GW2011_GWA1_38_7]OGE23188.1 MAG: hypothetical protein A2688_03530 [Candidatus Daviesbacteria bacterium RIFCSPHIGHO2_01_FULL_38_8]